MSDTKPSISVELNYCFLRAENFDIAKTLIKYGANVNMVNNGGESALIRAIVKSIQVTQI